MESQTFDESVQLLHQLKQEETNLEQNTELLRAELMRVTKEYERRELELRSLTQATLPVKSLAPVALSYAQNNPSGTQIRELLSQMADHHIPHCIPPPNFQSTPSK